MNRLPVAERREQLIEAALAVASRDGIDAATVRAIAAEAGVSLGVVHYCFQDKDELLRAMAHAITSQNLARSLGDLPEHADIDTVVDGVIDALWTGISESRGPQLLSYELTTSSLRHAELNQVAIEQYRGQWSAAEQVLELVERTAKIGWSIPRSQVARAIVAVIDGYSLAWLVDADGEQARAGLQGFGQFLRTLAVPVALEPDEGDHASVGAPDGATA